MPSKLQLKLLSNSGELLNVINCTAGRVCVFRGNTPSDLRPYQRALIGTQGKEKISVNVDGGDYNPDQQNVIGLGEAAPHIGMTVRQFFARCGLQDESLAALLSSYGLDGLADMKCSALSPDQERRVRILFAISQPDKVLVANEPFEHITSQWKERFAELLLDFARLKSGLVVIPSLSYRPECWIDNSLVARIEVGQSIQRTIGFGQAGSEANEMIEELRRKIQEDEREESRKARPQAAMMSGAATLGGASGADLAPPPSDFALIKAWLTSSESMAFKVVSSLVAAGIGIGGALFVIQVMSEKPAEAPPSQVALLQPGQPASAPQDKPKGAIDSAVKNAVVEAPQAGAGSAASVNKAQPAVRYILDGYAEVIRTSIIDTAHGNVGDVAAPSGPAVPEQQQQQASKSGNFYSLLEQAGSSGAGDGGQGAPPPPAEEEVYESDPVAEEAMADSTEEDQRREEIRAKFLEAIRAAAERRDATMEEE